MKKVLISIMVMIGLGGCWFNEHTPACDDEAVLKTVDRLYSKAHKTYMDNLLIFILATVEDKLFVVPELEKIGSIEKDTYDKDSGTRKCVVKAEFKKGLFADIVYEIKKREDGEYNVKLDPKTFENIQEAWWKKAESNVTNSSRSQ